MSENREFRIVCYETNEQNRFNLEFKKRECLCETHLIRVFGAPVNYNLTFCKIKLEQSLPRTFHDVPPPDTCPECITAAAIAKLVPNR